VAEIPIPPPLVEGLIQISFCQGYFLWGCIVDRYEKLTNFGHEAQDISPAHLRFCAALGADRSNALFFAGDLGQRIFQQPFSWKALGVDIRGRSRTLRVNYRTSHQIRTQADRLLGPMMTDVDGNSENRSDAVSVFNGPLPTIHSLKSESEEIKSVGNWIAEHAKSGVLPHEFGLFVRSEAQLDRARAVAKKAGLAFKVLDEHVETTSGHISIGTMHLGKGLEFRAVAVIACDDEVIPLQQRIETVGDDADLQEVYDTERHLLYVACTRARDHLLVTGVDPVSEFLDDFTKDEESASRTTSPICPSADIGESVTTMTLALCSFAQHRRVGEGSYFAAPPRSSLLFQCAYTIVRSMTRRSSGR
jgi:superfamily I DNA/RNA helicase